ncbi:MAG TPA: hypothetical protein VKD91_05815 [Pyrinomonadaceae bacterium]|nr:hypothetical protein [Pyrinomonadaceae bacterium]
MVIVFISAFAFAILFIIGIGLYFWQKSTPAAAQHPLPPPPDFAGLFGDKSNGAGEKERLARALREQETSSLMARAQNGERSVLSDAHQTGDPVLYDHLLVELVGLADTDEKLLALLSYVTKNEFRVNTELATAVVATWQKSPDRSGTSKALHFAALSDDASLYQHTVQQALQFWREGKMTGISASELRALFDGEFWILSSRTRSSGAGFVLKRTLDKARRELEAAAGANQ